MPIARLPQLKLLLYMCLLTACSPGPDCETSTGLAVYGSFECARIDQIHKAMAGMWREGRVRNLSGWEVRIHPDAWYSQEHHYKVTGLTYCQFARMEMSAKTWEQSSLYHELVHALDGCNIDWQDDDPYHPRWTERGLWQLQIDVKEKMQ